jgi:hypothetical protein
MQTSVWASPPSGSSLVSSAVDIQSETVPPEFGFIKDISSSYSRGLVAIREALIQAVQVIALDSCRVNNPRLRITYISNKKTVIRADCQGSIGCLRRRAHNRAQATLPILFLGRRRCDRSLHAPAPGLACAFMSSANPPSFLFVSFSSAGVN